jgi:hypothetical protein
MRVVRRDGKQYHKPLIFLWFIPPMKMVMTRVWFMIDLTTLVDFLWSKAAFTRLLSCIFFFHVQSRQPAFDISTSVVSIAQRIWQQGPRGHKSRSRDLSGAVRAEH